MVTRADTVDVSSGSELLIAQRWRNGLGIVAALLTVVLWSFSSFFVIRISSAISPIEIAGLRGFFAAPIVLSAIWIIPLLRPKRAASQALGCAKDAIWNGFSRWRKLSLFAMAILAYAIGSHAFVFATRNGNAAAATFFSALSPLVAAAVEYCMYLRTDRQNSCRGAVLTRGDAIAYGLLLACLVVFSIGRFQANTFGYLASLLLMVAWGGFMGLCSRMSESARYLSMAGGTFCTGCSAVPFFTNITSLAPFDWVLLMLLGVVSLGLPLITFALSMALVGRTSNTVLITTIQPIVTMFWIWLFAYERYLLEQFEWWHYLAAIGMLVTIASYNLVQITCSTCPLRDQTVQLGCRERKES